jgi:hypothetical protein
MPVATASSQQELSTPFAPVPHSNQEAAMADNKQHVGKPDRDHADKADPAEVSRVATKFGTSPEAVREVMPCTPERPSVRLSE